PPLPTLFPYTTLFRSSVHVLRSEDYPLPESVDRLLARADEIVMELDLDDIDSAEQQRIVLEKATLPSGTTLRDALPPATYAAARSEEHTSELQSRENL